MSINKNLKIDNSERCYPDYSGKRIINDHIERYGFAQQYAKDKIVLDIACGEGYGSEMIKNGGAKQVYGSDNDPKIIEYASSKYSGINFEVMDAAKTSYTDNIFDLIISFETWHHLDNYNAFIPEMHRILKLGGKLIVSVPNEKIIYLNPFFHGYLTKYYRVNFNVKKIKKMFNGFFEIEEIYGQRFVKRAYVNFFSKLILSVLSLINKNLKERISIAFKLADGARVKRMKKDNARYIIFVCKKI